MLSNVTPYRWLCFDIETANGSPEQAEAWMRREWAPNPTWKADTIGKRFQEALEKKLTRLALLDESPIVCVGLQSDTEVRVLHCLRQHPPELHQLGAMVEGFASEADMLVALRNVLEACVAPETELVGHNILEFDLPKLRLAFLRNGLRPPVAFLDRSQPIFDSMREWRRYSISSATMVSLSAILVALGIPNHKTLMTGADVPEYYAAGRHAEIIEYQLADVLAQSLVYLRLTGQIEDGLQEPAHEAPAATTVQESVAPVQALPTTAPTTVPVPVEVEAPAPVDLRPIRELGAELKLGPAAALRVVTGNELPVWRRTNGSLRLVLSSKAIVTDLVSAEAFLGVVSVAEMRGAA